MRVCFLKILWGNYGIGFIRFGIRIRLEISHGPAGQWSGSLHSVLPGLANSKFERKTDLGLTEEGTATASIQVEDTQAGSIREYVDES